MKTAQEVIATTYVQSWDQHIGRDGTIAILAALDAAGFQVVPKKDAENSLNIHYRAKED